MADQNGKTAWITGASSGIGEALAKAYLADGGSCVLSGRNVDALEAVAANAPERCLVLPFDTTDYASLPALVETAIHFRDGVDVLVNNAGISQRSLAIDTDLSVYQKIIDIDLLAPIALTHALLPHLLARGSGQVVMISSVAGKVGVPLRTAYCAAKHGLIGYADSLRSEVAGQGVSDKAIDNGIDPDFVARTIWAAVADGKREIVIAEGVEAQIPLLRASDPDKLFDMVEAMLAAGYAQKMQA